MKSHSLGRMLLVNNTFNRKERQKVMDEHWRRILLAKPKIDTAEPLLKDATQFDRRAKSKFAVHTATEIRLEKEQRIIEERLERRVRQTKTLNKHELMKDVKLIRKTNHEDIMKQTKLKKDNEVV